MSHSDLPRLMVKFSVAGIPDRSGLRIKTIDPAGVYISSVDSEAAQWYFQKILTAFVGLRDEFKGQAGMALDCELDWTALLAVGEGDVAVRAISKGEADETRRIGMPVTVPPVKELRVDTWVRPDGEPFFIVSDNCNEIDGWLVEAVQQDLNLLQGMGESRH